MFGFMKSPAKVTKQNSVDKPAGGSRPDPFDSDDEDSKPVRKPARRTSSEPMLSNPNSKDDSGSLEDKSVQELEQIAVSKAEDTTNSVNNCLKIAENIRGDASRTLDMLHEQGDQITRTHQMAADMDKDLSKGEKLLNNLGGMFSKPWKPKKSREIKGPVITADKPSKRSENNAADREKLGLGTKGKASRSPHPEPTNAMEQVQLEKDKQDDALSDLSNILGDLKGMAVDMGSELDRQNKSLDGLADDVDELNSRVKGANQRARKLVGK